MLLASLVFLAGSPVDAEPAKPSPGGPSGPASFESFRLIHTRNVFDPDRRPVRSFGGAPTSSAPTQTDYAALTGTMISTEKTYAFFSGSRPEFNKVLSVQDKFVNATIVGITGQSIEIERDGKRTTVLVGQTVPFDNQTAPGDPPVEAPPAEISASVSASAPGGTPVNPYRPAFGGYRPAPTGSPATAAGPTAPKGPPGNIEEIRRRMMEKRQQELK